MKRIALCIGNDEYSSLSVLHCAVADAKAISEELSKLKFVVIYKYNVSMSDMTNVINEFVEKVDDYDSCLFYYAGHGFQIDGKNILVPIDLNVYENNSKIQYDMFSLEYLMKKMDNYKDKTKIFILDACRTDINARGSSICKGFSSLLVPQGSIIAFATSPGQSSGEDENLGHGYYTNTLLQYISSPKISIETVFKKTRENLILNYGKTQIPWEHTSLVGDYFFNPNTLYSGLNYTDEALADSMYSALDDIAKKIIEALKSYNWYIQRNSLELISSLNFDNISISDLFVTGRNIYQAACGACYDAQIYINNFSDENIPHIAKIHLLNGMAYEIYYSSDNKLRIHPKAKYYKMIIQLLEKNMYYDSRNFILSVLSKIQNQIIYIPGQEENMTFTAEVTSNGELQALIYKGSNVLFRDINTLVDELPFPKIQYSYQEFVEHIACEVVAPDNCINVIGIEQKCIITAPTNFTIRKSVYRDNEQ